jgi:predicted CXXCH cytochrome family protein
MKPSSPPSRFTRPLAVAGLLSLLATLPGCGGGEPSAADGAPAVQPGPATDRQVLPAASRSAKPPGPIDPEVGCSNARCHTSIAATRFVHGVVRTGDCFVCHKKDQGGHVYPLRRPGNQGCTYCHDVAGNREHQHQANEAVGCTGCHDPHGSDHRFMLTSATVRENCLNCHLADEHAVPHGPYAAGECLACHEAHESSFTKLLRGGEGPEHCAMCHADVADSMHQAKRVHAPAVLGCTNCHDPHASDERFALRQPVKQTCFACHADLEKTVRGASAPHAAVFTGAECGNCHDPHAADRVHLLRDDQAELCLRCHDRQIESTSGRMIANMAPLIQDRRFLHGPVESGNCVACHNIHGATHSRLLRDRFTEEFYASFDLDNYALCFDCHDPDLVTAERTTALTNFRDGDVNLHYLHVNRQKRGRTCRACHDIHGSNLPAHMAESVPFEDSEWEMPVGFQQMANGGSCAPGCHKPATYTRTPPVVPQTRGGP